MFLVREYMKIQCFLVNVRIFSLSIPGTTATKRAYLHFVINWTLRNVSLYLTRTRQQQTNRKKKTIDDNFEKNLYFLSTLQRIQFSWNKSAYLFFTNKIKFRTIGEDNRSIISKFPFSWLIRTRLTFNPLMNNERMLYTWILWKWWKLWTL